MAQIVSQLADAEVFSAVFPEKSDDAGTCISLRDICLVRQASEANLAKNGEFKRKKNWQ